MKMYIYKNTSDNAIFVHEICGQKLWGLRGICRGAI